MSSLPRIPFATPRKLTTLSAIAAAAMLLSACGTVKVQPLTDTDVRQQAAADRQAAFAGVPPLAGKLSMDEAVARALKYNLDRRTRLMEEALAMNQLDTANLDMLPRVMANAGYTWRDEELITRSVDSVTGLPSLANPYISSERSRPAYSLGTTWNMLDFGLSYYGAKQAASRVGIAAERRRKAMHVLVQDVRSAFWRTVSAQKLRNEVRATIDLAEAALKDARKVEAERLRSPVDTLRYQRQLLENLRLLESIEQELASGRIELAALINAPQDAEFEVVEPAEGADPTMLEVPASQMEELAVTQNADLREHFYNTRIALDETRRTMVRMFPNLSFNYDLRYDSDKYLINNRWNEAGVHLSYNLMNLFTGPAQKRLAEAGVKLADQRRIASQMTVITQVHLARLQYQIAYRQYLRADQIWQADAKIAEHVKNREAAEAQSKLEQVANGTTAILSLLRRYQSLAQLQSAGSRLQATVGLEPVLGSVSELSLEQLTGEVGNSMRNWSKALTKPAAAPAVAEPAAAPAK
ncbi:TolC family protein [Massilia sp. IC2-278]|uniref:TolC family protein n=1 Tax=Massilia sp. IC2-278 TaxID=2887200 RepID=UPI001E4FDB9A|nr:TolC family protein [Massilia sp. IC2-278]MCC2961181.1 TolC family protein [Massilia sp. IC2-278]